MYQFPPELRAAYESMAVPFVYYQYENDRIRPVLVSDGMCRQLGLSRDQLHGQLDSGLFERIHPDDAGRVAQATQSFANHRCDYDLVFRTRREEGYHYIHAVGRWQTMPDGTELAVLTYSDVSQSEKAIELLSRRYSLFQEDRFYRDALTGLPNLNYLNEFADERINAIRAEGKTPALIYSDVVSMQFYNNHHGFSHGNDLLRLVASTLEANFPDVLLARASDDHFILIDAWESEAAASEKLKAVNEWIRTHAYGKTSGIQAGICVIDPNTSFAAAVDHARVALKRIGSDMNTTCRLYSRISDEQYWDERYIVQMLDRALEESWIKVFYQGITLLKTERTACFEALARWNDPNRGTISPGVFIPVLEKYRLLYKLDLYMVEQVCREVIIRSEAGLPMTPVSINFSAQDFDNRDIPEEIETLYVRYGMEKYVPRKYFIIEITERDMTGATERFHSQLRALRKKGYQLWLDDFGGGYSSLSMFSRFDFDLIKFDMDLIQDLDSRGGLNRKIIQAMITIARSMNIHTLAEGVETIQQRDFLKESGCELAQGFLYRRPQDLASILFMLESGSLHPTCEPHAAIRDFFG